MLVGGKVNVCMARAVFRIPDPPPWIIEKAHSNRGESNTREDQPAINIRLLKSYLLFRKTLCPMFRYFLER